MPPRPTIPRLTHLLLDFDETLTTHDTLLPLTTTAYRLRPSHLPPLPPWSYFVQSYLSSLPPAPSPPPCSLPAYLNYLTSPAVRSAEINSLARISQHGVFASLPPSSLIPDPHTIQLRKGFFSSVISPAQNQGVQVGILSVNWSSTWIRGCLAQGVREEGGDSTAVDGIKVRCNELEVADGLTTGEWTGEKIVDSGDKARVVKEVTSQGGLVAYVGDSSTDLRAMVEADVGIVVGDKMDELLERLRVRVVEGRALAGWGETVERVVGQDVLVKVRDMAELGKVLGLDGEAHDG